MLVLLLLLLQLLVDRRPARNRGLVAAAVAIRGAGPYWSRPSRTRRRCGRGRGRRRVGRSALGRGRRGIRRGRLHHAPHVVPDLLGLARDEGGDGRRRRIAMPHSLAVYREYGTEAGVEKHLVARLVEKIQNQTFFLIFQ